MNRIELTKKIFATFLKKEKVMGKMFIYAYSKYGSYYQYDMKLITETFKETQKIHSEQALKITLKSIIGKLYEPKDLIFKIDDTETLYNIYKKWCKFIENEWTEIYKLYEMSDT